ncbi:multiheme c-type cytochrome [Nitrosophilus alvini]|uniref:multiheme c-type cytochrome n=1 Tax=Nitrosophilus alvini TaxID=2714855 RepID=UPI0019096D48|nr:multiheme c-type cytochrome [Nitrosophilus alvini]
MRKLFITALSVLTLFGAQFAKNEECKECHPLIYQEFATSQHANSTIFKDEIHGAIWNIHPKKKKSSYSCAKCHTPAANNIKELISAGNGIVPDQKNPTQNEGISCAYCHRIESIKHEWKSNVNIISKDEKKYFGTRKDHIKSPFHKIDTSNRNFLDGNVCIGCHSHKKNKNGLNICSTNIKNEMDGSNCISCHMPKIGGSVSVLRKTRTHTFHGFPGAHTHQSMLKKYVDIEFLRNIEDFDISVNNKSSHALFLHPLRVAKLKVEVFRNGKKVYEDTKTFARIIGANGKPTPPWLAKEVIKNSMPGPNEKKVFKHNFKLEKGDKIKAVLGYYLVNPKMINKLGLQNSEIAKRFFILTQKQFKI